MFAPSASTSISTLDEGHDGHADEGSRLTVQPCIPDAGQVIRAPWSSLAAGGWVPRVIWHAADGIMQLVDGPDAVTTWREAEEASRF